MRRLAQSAIYPVVVSAMIAAWPLPARAITAEIAKKCDAAAFKAFPNQRTGSVLGIAQRSKFRKDCVANDGNIPSTATTSNVAPETRPAK